MLSPSYTFEQTATLSCHSTRVKDLIYCYAICYIMTNLPQFNCRIGNGKVQQLCSHPQLNTFSTYS